MGMNVVREEKLIRDRARGSATPSGQGERKGPARTAGREPRRKTRRAEGPGDQAEKLRPGGGNGVCRPVTRSPEGRGLRPGHCIRQ